MESEYTILAAVLCWFLMKLWWRTLRLLPKRTPTLSPFHAMTYTSPAVVLCQYYNYISSPESMKLTSIPFWAARFGSTYILYWAGRSSHLSPLILLACRPMLDSHWAFPWNNYPNTAQELQRTKISPALSFWPKSFQRLLLNVVFRCGHKKLDCPYFCCLCSIWKVTGNRYTTLYLIHWGISKRKKCIIHQVQLTCIIKTHIFN